MNILGTKMDDSHYRKLETIGNPELLRFIEEFVELCNPDAVYVSDDSPEDFQHFRETALSFGEEGRLATKGHTFHFDSFGDQGRDREHTAILLPRGTDLGSLIKTKDRDEGLAEVRGIMKDIMKGHTLFVCFFSLGPSNSEFSIPCVQLTDSSYVAHTETILFRPGYSEFVRKGNDPNFFRFVHSQGELDERMVSKNLDKRRIFIDLQGCTVYSANTQYGGNSIGLKKLAMRLAIDRASREDWLTEHMLVMGIHGPKDRVTYFTGAFPSMCGKTSTALLDGETVIGDDIAYIRKRDGYAMAVNVEAGMFGIIDGINSKDDILQWNALIAPGELIFCNVLVTDDGSTHWNGRDGDVPEKGRNFSGEWWKGKKDKKGKEIPCSHKNARFTVSLKAFGNLDPHWDDVRGVRIGGIVYGGRDSDTSVPVEESFDWVHGIITKGASLESESTAATLGKEGVREFNPMSNLDFLSIPIGKYIKNNLDFGNDLAHPPLIFSVNYFLKDSSGDFLNGKNDKKVWYKWMELRIHGDVGAVDIPTGRIPMHEDLHRLFKDVLDKDYSKDDYVKQFTLRIPENLAKLDRIERIYREKVPDVPHVLYKVLDEQRGRLAKVRKKHGDCVSPLVLREA